MTELSVELHCFIEANTFEHIKFGHNLSCFNQERSPWSLGPHSGGGLLGVSSSLDFKAVPGRSLRDTRCLKLNLFKVLPHETRLAVATYFELRKIYFSPGPTLQAATVVTSPFLATDATDATDAGELYDFNFSPQASRGQDFDMWNWWP